MNSWVLAQYQLQSFYFFDAWIVSSVACGSIFKLGLYPFDTTLVVSDKMVSDKRWSRFILYITFLKPGEQPFFFFFKYCWFPFIEKWYLEVIDWELWCSLLCWVILLLSAFLMDKIRNIKILERDKSLILYDYFHWKFRISGAPG